jgi:AcrR family transcriptional regulator
MAHKPQIAKPKPAARPKPLARSASNTTAKSKDTVASILKAAEEVLIESGYAGLTARAVAEKAGIAVGNLTYHFPSTKQLHRAMVEVILDRYLQRWQAFLDADTAGTLEAASIGEVLSWLIDDALEPRTAKLFRELWAMAEQSGDDAELMDDFYRQTVNAAAKVARRRFFPELSEDEAIDLAYLMAVLSEGSIVLFGTLPEARERVPRFRQLATLAFDAIAGQLPAIDRATGDTGTDSRRRITGVPGRRSRRA